MPNRPDRIELGSRLALVAARERTLAAWADARAGTAATGKVDVLLASVPDELPRPGALELAAPPPPARSARLDRRLRGRCARGRRLDSRASSLALVRSFASALDRRDLQRAHGYFNRSWKQGRAPVRRPHPFGEFAAAYRSVSCVRVAVLESHDRSEDGKWNTVRAWLAVRRAGGPTRVLFGLFWTHSATARAPWSLMGFWTRELSTTAPARPRPPR